MEGAMDSLYSEFQCEVERSLINPAFPCAYTHACIELISLRHHIYPPANLHFLTSHHLAVNSAFESVILQGRSTGSIDRAEEPFRGAAIAPWGEWMYAK